jgi:hypothetical protein
VRILSIDGGGYLGLATAAFLESAEHHFAARCADRFDLFCGTSTGAIIALALASGKSAADVSKLYQELGPKIFPPPGYFARKIPKLRGVLAARHDNTALKEALRGAFGDQTLGDLRTRGKFALVTAFALTSGRPKVFKTDHASDLTAHDRYLLRDVALASAAAPTYLPIVELNDPVTGTVERFCDGGLVANSPALLGYAEAVSHLMQQPSEVAVLSLATPRADLAERASSLVPSQRELGRGYRGWGMGERIITLSIDGASMITDSALSRIAKAAGARYVRVGFSQPPGLGLDVVTDVATETLRHLGADCARDGQTRADLAPFFRNSEAQ